MMRLAIYGKGGIGKSTISANLSAAMAHAGARVLQIGCDPKQDSTRLLLQGQTITTVLEYLRTTTPTERTLDAIVRTGFSGVACVEAGGPEPGVGCAGRGILSTFDLLDTLGINARAYDVTLYDVLGDVVCGGFAVPLRNEYADVIFIVTSGEFMALYAANNILRGVRNYEGRGPRVGGVILNRRGLVDEEARVRRFCDAVELPIVLTVPRSEQFADAERLGQTILQAYPESELAQAFSGLAAYLLSDPPRYPARPLAADDLEATVLGARLISTPPSTNQSSSVRTDVIQPARAEAPVPPKRYCSKSVRGHEVLHGCAFNGAMHTTMQIQDAVTVAHGPRSCAHLSSQGVLSSMRRVRQRYGIPLALQASTAVHSSDMDERVVIFGGNDCLEDTLRQAAQRAPSSLFVVTSCASGIIGDDVEVSIARTRAALGDTPVTVLMADGDMSGDYTQGVLDAMRAIAERYIDLRMQPDADAVNIVAEKNLAANTEANFLVMRELLDALGLWVNCRFIRHCTTAQLRDFLRGRINLLASDDVYGRTAREFLHETYQAPFIPSTFPVGFHATAQWLREVAAACERQDRAEAVIARHQSQYHAYLDALRPALAGKRLFIVTHNHQLDWVLDLAWDLEMEIVKVGILASAWDDTLTTKYGDRVPFVLGYPREQRSDDIRALRPDLTLTNFWWRDVPEDVRVDTLPVCPDVGFFSGVQYAQRWRHWLQLPPQEGWRHDL